MQMYNFFFDYLKNNLAKSYSLCVIQKFYVPLQVQI